MPHECRSLDSRRFVKPAAGREIMQVDDPRRFIHDRAMHLIYGLKAIMEQRGHFNRLKRGLRPLSAKSFAWNILPTTHLESGFYAKLPKLSLLFSGSRRENVKNTDWAAGSKGMQTDCGNQLENLGLKRGTEIASQFQKAHGLELSDYL